MKIKDPIHGYIELDKEEENLIDLPCMQRLRRIKQLTFSSLVYPSANHSRFEHTLGVMYIVNQYADVLELDEKRRKELRIAALFHDSGHGPWSHLSEKVLDFDHEKESCKLARKHEDKYEADSDRVCKIIKGELEIGKVLHGDVDADRLDYLQRDAYKTGVEHGMIDAGTIIENAEINSRRIVYDEKAIQALESLLVARSHMIKSVYQHHTARIADKMIEEAVRQENLPPKVHKLDDYQIDRLFYGNEMYDRVMERKLYKRAFKFGREDNITRDKLVEDTGLSQEKILLDRGINKESPKRESNSLDIKIKKSDGTVENLRNVSTIPSSVFKSLVGGYWWVYTTESEREKVKRACEKLEA